MLELFDWAQTSPDEAVAIVSDFIDGQLEGDLTKNSNLTYTIRLCIVLTMTNSPKALEPLVRVMWHTYRVEPELYEKLLACACEFGQSIVEPALEMYWASTDQPTRNILANILTLLELEDEDERIFELVMNEARRDIKNGASLAMIYGNPRALPFLYEAFDAHRHDADGNETISRECMVVYHAVMGLGGHFTAEQETYIERISEALHGDHRSERTTRHDNRARCRTNRHEARRKRKQQRKSRKRNRMH